MSVVINELTVDQEARPASNPAEAKNPAKTERQTHQLPAGRNQTQQQLRELQRRMLRIRAE